MPFNLVGHIFIYTFEKVISNQTMFASDSTTNIQFSKMQNEIYDAAPRQM